MKSRRKLLSILLTLSLLVTLLVPMVGPASAASTYTMTSVNKIKSDYSGAIGNLVITMDGASVIASTPTKFVYFDLPTSPSGYEIFPGTTVNNPVAGAIITNNVPAGDLTVTKTSATQFKVSLNTTGLNGVPQFDSSRDTLINIPLTISVPGGVSGDINLTANAQSSSTFTSGKITIARVGVSSATLAVENVPTRSSGGGDVGVIDVKEDTMGTIINSGSTVSADGQYVTSQGSVALKLTLPPGFKWRSGTSAEYMWGDANLVDLLNNGFYTTADHASKTPAFSTTNDDRELDISVPAVWNSAQSKYLVAGSNGAAFFKLHPSINVDESIAKAGDITVTVSGAVSTSPASIVVGRYGDYTVTSKAFSTVDVVAGKAGQDIGKVEVDESIPGSLIGNADGRTITMTLPDNVKWAQLPTLDPDNSKNYGTLNVNWVVVDSDAKMIKGTVTGSTTGQTDPGTVVFKNMQVTPAVDFSGDLNVTLGGSEGLQGTLKLGTVKSAVTVKAASTPDVKVGLGSQAIGDLTITENMAGALDGTVTYSQTNSDKTLGDTTKSGNNAKLTLKAPAGVTFDGTPTVTVTDGDLQIDQSGVSTDTSDANEGLLFIKIKSSSTKASTIKVSGLKMNINRTLPEGALSLNLQDTAVNETLDSLGNDTFFPGRKTAATVQVANVVTPADVKTKAHAVFKIGDTKFSLNGADQTMDAAPYLKNDRTYLPLRFVAKAVGVQDSNIIWNADEQSVTLIKEGSVVKLTIGSNTMTINGTPITMDVAPEIVDPGRTMLPVRWVAQALGADIQWDAATQTVTVN